jgi:hypothetical protein
LEKTKFKTITSHSFSVTASASWPITRVARAPKAADGIETFRVLVTCLQKSTSEHDMVFYFKLW